VLPVPRYRSNNNKTNTVAKYFAVGWVKQLMGSYNMIYWDIDINPN